MCTQIHDLSRLLNGVCVFVLFVSNRFVTAIYFLSSTKQFVEVAL